MKNLYFLFFVLSLISCGNDANSGNEVNGNVTAKTTTDSSNVPATNKLNLQVADSIEVYFFKDPAKQSVFTRLFLTDKFAINTLAENLDQPTALLNECPHDGKIYFYHGGDVFKTVYIATDGKCRYFAYAINANKYFVPINDSAYSLISRFRSQAK